MSWVGKSVFGGVDNMMSVMLFVPLAHDVVLSGASCHGPPGGKWESLFIDFVIFDFYGRGQISGTSISGAAAR